MYGNCSTNQRSGNGGNSLEADQKVIKLGEYHNECVHQVWSQSPERYVRKCTEATQMWRTKERTKETNKRTDKAIQLFQIRYRLNKPRLLKARPVKAIFTNGR